MIGKTSFLILLRLHFGGIAIELALRALISNLCCQPAGSRCLPSKDAGLLGFILLHSFPRGLRFPDGYSQRSNC